MPRWGVSVLFLAGWLAVAGPAPDESNFLQQLVRRSVTAMDRDWQQAPEYVFRERDVETNGRHKTLKTQRVWMIDGSPYYELTGLDGEPLTPGQRAAEQRKLRHEVEKRRHESPSARSRRIEQYMKERRQDNALMREMADAFAFKLVGQEKLNGRDVYLLDASPKPGYRPKSMETRVLTGMRGRLWIDRRTDQWVKVEAEVFEPVTFGFFVAKVQPGTRFELEQAPVTPEIWLPVHFRMSVNASILWWQKNTVDDETYSDYQPKDALSVRLTP